MLVSPSSGFLGNNIDQKPCQCTSSTWILFSLDQHFSRIHITSTVLEILTPSNTTQSKMSGLLLWNWESALEKSANFYKPRTKQKIRESNWPSTPHENLQKNEDRSGHHGRGTTRCAYRLILLITGKVASRGKERKHRKKRHTRWDIMQFAGS